MPQTSQKPIYLAGPVENANQPRSWRDAVKRDYPRLKFIDPTDFETEWSDDPRGVIEKELEICESHPILANNLGSDSPRTVGTHHEIAHALAHDNKWVVAVCRGEPAGFIKHRVPVCESVPEAIDYLTNGGP